MNNNIGSNPSTSSNFGGVPNSMNNNIGSSSSIGNSSLGSSFDGMQQSTQSDMSFEDAEKKKFPLSTREIVLVSIAILAIIGVVIYYALM